MAISFVGQNTQDSVAALSLTFDMSGISYQANDFAIVFVKQSENTGQQEWDDDGGGGNGWVRQVYNRTTGGRDQETAIYTKVLSASETNPTFTWATGITAEPMSGGLLVYRGVDPATPFTDLQFAEAQNDANPPNPGVSNVKSTDTIITFHAATHDDITTPSPPTGYTNRVQVWNGTSDDHRNLFVADLINNGNTGNYTPPDWQHTVANTTPEYHTYTMVIQEIQPIGITDFNTTETFQWGNENLIVTGFGFEAVQGTGKIEFWDDTVGTTKQIQTIDSWSDTSIQIDTVQGSLPTDTIIYLVATNDSGDESFPVAIIVGITPYQEEVIALSPDHAWSFDNTFNDVAGGGRPASTNIGTPGFSANPLTRGATDSFTITAQNERIEIADTVFMNAAALAARSMGGWIRITEVQDSFVCFYEEGGGVNNLAFFMGMGGVLIAQLADTGDDNVHAYSDFKLQPNRNYHILFRYDYTGDNLFELFVDGVKQSSTFGNPLTSTGNHLDGHSGDIGWGDAEGNLEVFGTDITFPAAVISYYQHWHTWTEGLSDSDIRDKLFIAGCRGDIIITTGTESAMQTQLDAYASTVRPNSDCTFRIQSCSDGDFTLDFDNITFDNGTTIQVMYVGNNTLTAKNINGSNLEVSKMSAPYGGTINIVTPASITITGLIAGSKVRVFEANTTTEIGGIESSSTSFALSVETSSIDISILSLGYQNLRLKEETSTSDRTIPIVQQIDRQYQNP